MFYMLNSISGTLRITKKIGKKIWTIANERYKGWRATLSAMYRAYTTNEERMRHKPEELDIVEWHHLVLYIGKTSF